MIDTDMFGALRATVHSILTHANAWEWSVQGFGMMRTYFGGKTYRLNVWDSSLAVPGVSTIHDHPWDFTSWIIAGSFVNTRYGEKADSPYREGERYEWMTIQTGEGGGATKEGGCVKLSPGRVEQYKVGGTYRQIAEEIHESTYEDGTVTLNRRTCRDESEWANKARVFWPAGQAWVDAEPRAATPAEINRVIGNVLERWDIVE